MNRKGYLSLFLAVSLVVGTLGIGALGIGYRSGDDMSRRIGLSPNDAHEDSESRSRLARKDFDPPEVSKDEALQEFVAAESQSMGLPDSDPDATEVRLRSYAQKLSPRGLDWLQREALDPALDGDERAIAVYMLGQSGTAQAANHLSQVALAEKPISRKETEAFESSLRIEAVEALGQVQDRALARQELQRILQGANDAAVVDRARRTLMSLDGKAPDPKVQDTQALEQILND